MKKNLVIIDDNTFFLKKANMKIKTLLAEHHLEDKVEVIIVSKNDIFAYRRVDPIDVALVDFSFILPEQESEENINGLQICKEILLKYQSANVAIITALPDVRQYVDEFNFSQESQKKVILLDRGFESITKFILESIG